MFGHSQHGIFVEEWEREAGAALPIPEIRELYQRAFDAIWQRSIVTLGETTLVAIAERVLWGCLAKFPWMACIQRDKNGYGLGAIEKANIDESTLRLGLRALLVSFLDLIAALTANALSPQLRTELLLVKARTSKP